MTRISIQLFFVALLAIFSLGPAHSQTTYSLYELTQLANKQSETIKIAEEDLFIAEQDKARAFSVLVPRATAFGNIMEYKEDNIGSPDTTTYGAKLTQSFTLNGKELIAFDITKKTIEGKEYSLESIRADYLLEVSQSYYNILSAQRILEIAEADVERLTTQRDAVREKLSVGNVTKTDLYRAEAELSKAMTDRVIGINNVLQNKAALQNLVRLDDDFELKKEAIPQIEQYQSTLEEIKTYALENRTEVKEAKKNLEIAEKAIKFKKSDYWPTVSLEAGYRETDIEYNASPIDESENTDDLYISGELVFTLYDGGLRRAEIKQAMAEKRKAQNALALQEKRIILESTSSYLEYTAAKIALLNLQDELKFSEENYNAVQMQYKYGMADIIDIVDANSLLVSAQRRVSDAENVFYIAVLKILYTRGDLIPFLSTLI